MMGYCRQVVRLVVAILIFCVACKSPQKGNPHVEITTTFGEFEIELFPKQAPITVAAFLSYIDSGYYDRASFYRVLLDNEQPSYAPKSEIIQGGIWKANPRLLSKIPGIKHEPTSETKLLHTNGTVSLARLEPGSAHTEFFICIGDQPGYDYGGANNPDGQGYAAFGRVVRGMDVVNRMYVAPERDGQLDPQIYITNIKRL